MLGRARKCVNGNQRRPCLVLTGAGHAASARPRSARDPPAAPLGSPRTRSPITLSRMSSVPAANLSSWNAPRKNSCHGPATRAWGPRIRQTTAAARSDARTARIFEAAVSGPSAVNVASLRPGCDGRPGVLGLSGPWQQSFGGNDVDKGSARSPARPQRGLGCSASGGPNPTSAKRLVECSVS